MSKRQYHKQEVLKLALLEIMRELGLESSEAFSPPRSGLDYSPSKEPFSVVLEALLNEENGTFEPGRINAAVADLMDDCGWEG